MKVLLISANTVRVPFYIYPIGIDYVAGAIGDAHSVKRLDMNMLQERDALHRAIEEFAPDVVGLSLRNIDSTDQIHQRDFVNSYVRLASTIRESSDATLVLGGSGFTLFPEALMDSIKADFGVVGEGERLPLLLDALERKDPCDIPGVLSAGARSHIPPPWDGPVQRKFDRAGDIPSYYIRNGGMLNIQSRRGCPYKCIYCTYPCIEGSTLRFTDPDEVAETAAVLADAGARYIYFSDSVFNNSYDHGAAIAEAFIRKGLRVPWGAFFSPTAPPPDYYPLLRRSGLTHVEFGTESLSDSVLEAYQKPFSVSDVYRAHEAALRAGAYVCHYYLNGGPGENARTLSESLANAESLRQSVMFFFCGMRIYPGTALREIALSEGQIGAEDPLLSPVYYQSNTIDADIIHNAVMSKANGRDNWIIGSGGSIMARHVARLHKKGISGPLWEYLIR